MVDMKGVEMECDQSRRDVVVLAQRTISGRFFGTQTLSRPEIVSEQPSIGKEARLGAVDGSGWSGVGDGQDEGVTSDTVSLVNLLSHNQPPIALLP